MADQTSNLQNNPPDVKDQQQEQAVKEQTPEAKNYDFLIKTNNDKEWADNHCIYLFDKYINTRDDKEQVDVGSKIWSVMKDLHIFFRIEETDNISQKAIDDLGDKTVRDNTYFREKMYEWVAQFREMSIEMHLAEGINLIKKGIEKYRYEINQYFQKQDDSAGMEVSPTNMEKIIEDVKKIIHIRLLSLDHSLPKDDSSIVDENEEKQFAEMIKKLAEESKILAITGDNLKDMLLLYLQNGKSKYSFAYLPDVENGEGLDPYEELNDREPNEVKADQALKEKYKDIDDQIQKALDKDQEEKVGLLKKIKQLKQLLEHASRAGEVQSIQMMIDDNQKKIDELDELDEQQEEAEGEDYEEDEGEDFDQYESQVPQSKVSDQGETLEEKREKGLKEIFHHYARSQMMIGRKATFEQIQHEISNLNLGEYMKFCKDFKINCDKVKIAEIFKKIAMNSKELFYDEFKDTLWKLFEARDQLEIEKLKKRLREIRKISKSKKMPQKQEKVMNKDLPDKLDKGDLKDADQKDTKEEQASEMKKDPEKSKDEVDESKNEKEKQAPSQPKMISRPKGGDPKNMETLQELQRKDSNDSDIDANDANKKSDKIEDQKIDDDINKKVEVEDDQKDTDVNKDTTTKDVNDTELMTETGELQQEKQRILKRIEELKAPTKDEYQDQILEFLECDNAKAYKKKNKGFSLPFNTRAKYEDTNNYKFKRKQNIEEIKQKVQTLKKQRQQVKEEKDNHKNTQYIKGQNVMRRMHEDLLRDKGIYVPPGTQIGSIAPQMHAGSAITSAGKGSSKYRMPRKFTLESLGKMDYRDFIPPTKSQDEDEFKPSDVLDSDEDMDEEIENMYNFKTRDQNEHNSYHVSPDMRNSVDNTNHHYMSAHTSQILPKNPQRPPVQKGIKNSLSSVPISTMPQKIKSGRVNQSRLPPQKRQTAAIKNQYSHPTKKGSLPRGRRGHSVIHQGTTAGARANKRSKSKAKMQKGYRSSTKAVSDYSPKQKRSQRLKNATNKSMARANEYDSQAKRKQEQKLRNILKMHSKKAIPGVKKNRL